MVRAVKNISGESRRMCRDWLIIPFSTVIKEKLTGQWLHGKGSKGEIGDRNGGDTGFHSHRDIWDLFVDSITLVVSVES